MSIILLAQPVASVVLARVLLVVGGIGIATIPVGRMRDQARAALA